MTYEIASGISWQGMLSDGTINIDEVAQRLRGHFNLDPKNPCRGLADVLYITRKKLRKKATRRTPPVSECGATCDSIRTATFCESYVLSVKLQLNGPKQSHITPYVTPLMDEFFDYDPNRFLFLTLSNCIYLTNCTKEALDDLGFIERPKEEYQNYEKFSKASQKLIEDTILYFEAPCWEVSEYLRTLGFVNEHVTYS